MPLQKSMFKLPLAQSMNQKTDAKTLTGGITLVKNGIHRKEGRVSKRAGWTSLVRTLSAGGSLSSADACASYENELILWAGNHIYTWSTAQQLWYDRGAAYSAAITTKQIISNNSDYPFSDSAYTDGVVLVAYESSGGIRYQTYDYETGAVLKGDTQLVAIGFKPKCITINNLFYVIYSVTLTTNILGAIISPVTGAVTSTVTLATNNTFAYCFDVLAIAPDTIMLSYAAAVNIATKFFNAALGPRGAPYTDTVTASGSPNFLRLIPISGGRVALPYANTSSPGSFVQVRIYSPTGAVGAPINTGLLIDIEAGEIFEFAGHEKGADLRLYVHFNLSATQDRVVYKADVSTSGGANTSGMFMRSVGLAVRGFMHNGVGFVGVYYQSTLQSSLFIVDEFGVVVTRHQPGTFGTIFFQNISRPWSAVNGRYEFAITNKTRIIAITDTLNLYTFSGNAIPSATNLYSPTSVAITSLDFQANSNFSSAELGSTLLIVGGVLNMYDGISVVEHGFLIYPEGLTFTATVAGSVPIGTYLYTAIYEWTDAKGMIHRSAPSLPLSVTVASSAKRVDIKVPTLRVTQKKSPARANVRIVLYRTATLQSTPYYRVSSITLPTLNDVTIDSVTIQDDLLDTQLPGREILYTAGGILDNTAALPAKFIRVWRGRVMLGGGEESAIQYSKPVQKGAPVEFSAENILELESDGGPMTGFEILDEKLVTFKNDWCYLTYGDGPDALGLNGMFAPLERIASCDVGCIDQQSTCAIPGAVLFKSEKGYQLLGRDLSASYIGAPVEDYNSLSVTSATLFATQSEIRITNSNGVTLVYNYEFSRWSAFDNYDAVDGMRWQNQFVHVKSDARVCIETEGTFRDDGVNYDVTQITGWQALADIAGFQRIYRAQIVGDYKSPCSLSLRAAFDYDDTWIDSGSFVLGASSWRWQFFMKRQKCEAVRFEINTSVAEFILSGEGCALTSMTLLFGIKAPLAKLPSAQKAGLSTI